MSVETLNAQFIIACKNGNITLAIELLAKGANINAHDNTGYTALHWAARSGNLVVLEYLIEQGAIVDITDNHGWTPLFAIHCSTSNCVDCAKYLIQKGANVDLRDDWNATALHYFLLNKHIKISKYLFFECDALMPIAQMFEFADFIYDKQNKETEAQAIFDYFLQNKSRYNQDDIKEFKQEFLKFDMEDLDASNLKPIIKFL